jgi:hypothetical protein
MVHRKILISARAQVLLATKPACTYDGAGRQLPQLDYQNISALYVSAGSVDVITQFRPTLESSKAAAAFTTRPEDALNRYAVQRLKAQGGEGTLRFTIEDATVKHAVVDPDNSVMKWADVGKQDRYDLNIRVGLSKIEGDNRKSANAVLEMERFITVPQSFSIAKREKTLRDFMQKVVGEMDGMVTTALRDRLSLAVSGEAPMNMPAQPAPYGTENNTGPSVPSLPVSTVKPEPLPPPW